MYKEYLLKCQIFNLYNLEWKSEDFYFDSEEEMVNFIKNGNKDFKPRDIRVEAMFKLERLYVCKETQDKWFGQVRWHNDDLASALEDKGIAATEENIAKLRSRLDNHWFTDHMVAAGWDYIHNCIKNLEK